MGGRIKYYLAKTDPSDGSLELLTHPGTDRPIRFTDYEEALRASSQFGGDPISELDLFEMGVCP